MEKPIEPVEPCEPEHPYQYLEQYIVKDTVYCKFDRFASKITLAKIISKIPQGIDFDTVLFERADVSGCHNDYDKCKVLTRERTPNPKYEPAMIKYRAEKRKYNADMKKYDLAYKQYVSDLNEYRRSCEAAARKKREKRSEIKETSLSRAQLEADLKTIQKALQAVSGQEQK